MATCWRRRCAKMRRFACVKAHLADPSIAVSDLGARRAGADGARSRAISDELSANICRGIHT